MKVNLEEGAALAKVRESLDRVGEAVHAFGNAMSSDAPDLGSAAVAYAHLAQCLMREANASSPQDHLEPMPERADPEDVDRMLARLVEAAPASGFRLKVSG